MTLRVLVSCPYFLPVVEEYRGRFSSVGVELITVDVVERLSESELLPLVGEIDGALCGDDAYTSKVFDAAPRLRVIAKWGTGIDSIDTVSAAERGIRVLNTPNAFTEPVADSVLGYMLAFARRQPWMDREMKAGRWEKLSGRALGECSLGIVGVGNIGKAVARRARAFGMTVWGNDLRDQDPDWETLGVRMVSFERLLATSDFVTLNCDLRPGNRHLIGEPELARMKPDGVLVNTARGPLIDQQALWAALETGSLGGAALDVFEEEPIAASNPLMRSDKVMLAPHNSNSSPKAWRAVHESTVGQLITALIGVS